MSEESHTLIDISTLTLDNKALLLRELAIATKPVYIYVMTRPHENHNLISLEESLLEIKKDWPIDYFRGRAIKIDFRRDVIDYRLYDRDAGEGKFMEVWNKTFGQSG
jgi:hypothetical protein